MSPVRHRSPKSENTISNLYFKSPKKKEENIINFNKPEIIQNHKNININNHIINYNNINNYNYYEEIKKAFNFITFILKQKDNQIKELKIKIKALENQISDINDKNIMTFKKKEINSESPSNTDNLTILNITNFKRSTFNNNNQNKANMLSPNSDPKKYNQLTHYTSQAQKQNNKNDNNYIIKSNNKLVDNTTNNINIIHKIKNSTNINKINNYRNITEITNKQDSNNKYSNSEMVNKQINMNINEHSSEKKNVNKIRKEPYHTSQNQNIKMRNVNGNKNNNYTTETESSIGTDKMKILAFDHSMSNLGKPNSKSNSFSLSGDGNFMKSKLEVKNYLKEVKRKLEPLKFKKFITLIKNLIKNKNSEQKNQFIFEIKNLLGDKILITKFENIMKVK